MFNIPQSTSYVLVFKAYLSSDHVTEATGKTIAITISKAGGAFGNPNAGATNATEISSGWYKVTLDTTDTGTLGAIAVRGAVATIDDVGLVLNVISATTGGATNLDATVSSRATQTSVDTIDDFLDTEVAAILAAVDTEIAAIKTKTDQLTFTTANRVDSQVFGMEANTVSSASIASGAITSSKFAGGAINAAVFAADAITAAKIAADVTTELQTGLATQTSLDAVKAKTDLIPGTQDGKTFAETILLMASVTLGKASGMGTSTCIFRALDDSQDRVTATIDADGNRTAVTFDTTSP